MKILTRLVQFGTLAVCWVLVFLTIVGVTGCATQHPKMAMIPMYITAGNPPQPLRIPDGYSIVSEADGLVYAQAILQLAQQQVNERTARENEDRRIQEAAARLVADQEKAKAAKPRPAPKPKPAVKAPPLPPTSSTVPLPMTPAAKAEGK